MAHGLEGNDTNVDDSWEMSRCLQLVPFACIGAASKGTDMRTIERERRQWTTMFRHSYIAKQILDDMVDIWEDTRQRTKTPFTQHLHLHNKTLDLKRLRETIVEHARCAVEHLTSAQTLAKDIGADNWAGACAKWLSAALDIRQQAARAIRQQAARGNCL